MPTTLCVLRPGRQVATMPDQTTAVFMGAEASARDLDVSAVALSAVLHEVEPSAAVAVSYERREVKARWSVSPSVRLARWLDAGGRRVVVAMTWKADGGMAVHLWCPRVGHVIGDGHSRDAAITATVDKAEAFADAVDKAEAGATTEGEQHGA